MIVTLLECLCHLRWALTSKHTVGIKSIVKDFCARFLIKIYKSLLRHVGCGDESDRGADGVILFSSSSAERRACGLLWSEHAQSSFFFWWVGLLLIPGCAVCRTSCQCVWLMWTSWRRDWMRLRSTGGLSRQKLPPSPCVQTPLITEHLSSLHERLGRPSHSQHQTRPIHSSLSFPLPLPLFALTLSLLLNAIAFSLCFLNTPSTALSASLTLSPPPDLSRCCSAAPWEPQRWEMY